MDFSDDEGDVSSAELKVDPLEHVEYVARLSDAAVKHLQEFGHSRRVDYSLEIERLTETWLAQFYAFLQQNDHFSITDLAFVALCQLMCGNDPLISERCTVTNFSVLCKQLRIHSFRHTRTSMQTPPNLDKLQELMKDCASWITHKLGYERADVDRLTMFHFEDAEALKKVDTRLMAFHYMPTGTEAAAEASVISQQDMNKENKGEMWVDDAMDYVESFVRIGCRLFAELECQRRMLHRFALHYDAEEVAWMDYHPAIRERLHDFVVGRSGFEASEDFILGLREMCYDFAIPVGSKTEGQRKQITKNEKQLNVYWLEKELGIDTCQYVIELAGETFEEIAKNPEHLFFEALVLFTFQYMMFHETRFEMLKKHYVSPHDMLRCYAKNNVFEEGVLFEEPRRPIVTRVLQTWYVFHNMQWIACVDLTDALIKWMILMEKRFGGETEDEIDVTSFIAKFVHGDNTSSTFSASSH